MSVLHKILGKRPLELANLRTFALNIEGIRCVDRGEKTLYFWDDGKSVRGFDISHEENYIEVRNTVLSNRFDYELTNKIVTEILTLTDGIVFNEEDVEVKKSPLFDNDTIIEKEIRDCEMVRMLSKEYETTILGPIRKVYFGERMYKELISLNGKDLRNTMFDLVLTVNYRLPDYDSPNIMLVNNRENDEGQKKMIVLSNEVNCIFGRHDNILLYTEDNPIMITNEILNTMLPLDWTLVDEYTIIAPMIGQKEWEKFLANAKKFDLFETRNKGCDYIENDSKPTENQIEPIPTENVFEKLKHKYDCIGIGPNCGRIAVKKRGLTGFVDIEGNEVIPTIYRSAMSFIDGMSVVSLAVHKFGLIDTDGKEIIPCKYDNVRPYQNGFARVEKGIYWAVIDEKQNFIISFDREYQRIVGFENGLARVKKGTKWGVINLNGRK